MDVPPEISLWVLTARFAPQNCGIGEQTQFLLGQLRERQGIEGGVLVASPQWDAAKAPALPRSQRWTGSPPPGTKVLMLQYSGYGYAKRGAPVRLAMQIRRLRRERPEIRLVTMFHELFAYGPPTSSSFWLSPVQRWVALSLARHSHQVITNRSGSARWLENRIPAHRGRIHASPVFSNLGEACDAPPPSQREAHLVFFGYQAELWDAGFTGLRRVIEALKPARVTILGRSAEIPGEVFDGIAVTRTGYLSAEEVSTILRTARWGLVAYNPEYLGKSSLLAAFMAHGVVPLLVDGHLPLSEGLERGVHLLAINDLGSSPPDLDAISAAGQAWYLPHNREHTAAAFAKLLLGACGCQNSFRAALLAMIVAVKPSFTLSPAETRGRYAFTVRDYHQLVSSGHFTRADRIELIEGELTIMPPIVPEHSYHTTRITNTVPFKLPAGVWLRMNEPVTIPEHSEPQPDAAVVKEREDGYRKAHPLPEDVLLIIEVADTSVEFDMKVKSLLYARAGIPEYWVVDVKAGCLHVFTSASVEGYQNCQMLGAEDSVICQSVPGLQITAKQLLG